LNSWPNVMKGLPSALVWATPSTVKVLWEKARQQSAL
jgi:hypothetical protein